MEFNWVKVLEMPHLNALLMEDWSLEVVTEPHQIVIIARERGIPDSLYKTTTIGINMIKATSLITLMTGILLHTLHIPTRNNLLKALILEQFF